MTHTTKFHDVFWRGMGQRFEKSWFDLAGPTPTKAWRELLDKFTRDEVDAALLRLKDRPQPYVANPPTYAEFQGLLSAAASHRTNGNQPSQGPDLWRGVVVAECMKCAGLLNIVPYGGTRLDQLPDELHRLAIAKCDELVRESRRRRDSGKSVAEITSDINRELWNWLKPRHQPGEHYVGHLSAGGSHA